ncbi:MAG: flavin reductase [Butyrivibrio sp.]|nr:flavin reductase [Butyrivibrio sp.]
MLASVNKNGHLYKSLQETGQAVINFFSADQHAACMDTIKNNQFDADEITASGLTVTKASWVNAPMVGECFMNLECKLAWEKEIVPDDDHVILCLEIIGAHIDEDHLADKTGDNGLLYNIHYPVTPEKVGKTAHDYAGVLQKKIDVMEY